MSMHMHVEEWVGRYEMNSTVFVLHVSCLKAIFCYHRDCFCKKYFF